MKVFLDTNVLVAAFATRGLCADILRHVLAEHELIISHQVQEELHRALLDKLRVADEVIEEIEALLSAQTVVPVPSEPAPVRIKDSDDALILAAALAAKADVLVTGDKDLLDPAIKTPMKIVMPREFWEQLRRGK